MLWLDLPIGNCLAGPPAILVTCPIAPNDNLGRRCARIQMHALGALAGGIAHDFNNMLAAILGYAAGHGRYVTRVCVASSAIAHGWERAKDLVRQILTVSRQQEQQRL